MKCEVLLLKEEQQDKVKYFIGVTPEDWMIGVFGLPIVGVEVENGEIIKADFPNLEFKSTPLLLNKKDKNEILNFISTNPDVMIPDEEFKNLMEVCTKMPPVVKIEIMPQQRKGNYKFSSGHILSSKGFNDAFGENSEIMLQGILAGIRKIAEMENGLYFEQNMKVDGREVVVLDELKDIRVMLKDEYPILMGSGGGAYEM